ncbi:MAG TPA: type II secretion system F family protein [Blastocatellia bacterium]|nr:type II secretion system F family protein [Blastocatellia bacterium]
MTLLVLTLMIFLVTLGLLISSIYFFIEAPAAKKRVQARLAAIEQASVQTSGSSEVGLMRGEILGEASLLNRILLQTPLALRLQLFVEQSALKITVGMLLFYAFAAAFVAFLITFLLRFPLLVSLPIIGIAAAIPFMVVAYVRQRRFAKFEELFPDAMDMLARAVRAGHAFTTAFELIAREMPEPLATEFRITFEQQNLGLPLKDALHNLSVRMPLPDVRFFSSALQIQRESGGNLAEILDNLSFVVRERFKILRQVKVHTAQGRLTMKILMALPPTAGFLMYMRNPKYMDRLFTDPMGHWAIAVAIILQIIGFFVIRKIIRIKV